MSYVVKAPVPFDLTLSLWWLESDTTLKSFLNRFVFDKYTIDISWLSTLLLLRGPSQSFMDHRRTNPSNYNLTDF